MDLLFFSMENIFNGPHSLLIPSLTTLVCPYLHNEPAMTGLLSENVGNMDIPRLKTEIALVNILKNDESYIKGIHYFYYNF